MSILEGMNLHNTITKLSELIQFDLPGEDAHLPMSPLGRLKSSEALKTAVNHKLSAVSVILFEKEQQHNFILTQRQTYPGAHSGQIAFPGGKFEHSDKNTLQTAIRESKEEINIQLSHEMHLGKLTNVYIPVSNFLIEPHVFWAPKNFTLTPEKREVHSIFDAKIIDLLAEDNCVRRTISIGNNQTKEVPGFLLSNKFIWGATALILNELKILFKQIS